MQTLSGSYLLYYNIVSDQTDLPKDTFTQYNIFLSQISRKKPVFYTKIKLLKTQLASYLLMLVANPVVPSRYAKF